MFKKQIHLFLLILLPFIGFWVYETMIMRPSDLETYQDIVKKKEIASSSALSSTNQHRKKVQKDIWFSQNDTARLHYQIASEGSLLTLTPIKNKFEIVESLEGIHCWMQDKLVMEDAPMQQTRLIEADHGLYHYTTQQFTASGVLLSLFRLPGHTLPTKPLHKDQAFLQGTAQDVSFIFSGKTPQFQADQFEATVVKE